MDIPTSPSSSGAATSSSNSGSTTGSVDSASTAEQAQPRRRLVKSSSGRPHFEDSSGRVVPKREGGSGAGPPGFGFDRAAGAPGAPVAGVGAGAANPQSGMSTAPANLPFAFRDRERPIRPSVKGEVPVDYPSAHGSGGSSSQAKLGRPPFSGSPGPMEARPLGRRPEANLRRHEPPPAQKHAEDMRIQQAKRAAVARAQAAGAPGHYKSFDSPFGNYLVPVIPIQFAAKTSPPNSQPTSPSPGQGR